MSPPVAGHPLDWSLEPDLVKTLVCLPALVPFLLQKFSVLVYFPLHQPGEACSDRWLSMYQMR